MLKKAKLLLVVTILSSSAALTALFWWGGKEVELKSSKIILVKRGASLSSLTKILANERIILNTKLFKAYVKIFGKFELVQAGNYSFNGKISARAILDKIKAGETHKELMVSFTIPEGFTLEQVLRRLEAKGIDEYIELKKTAEDSNFIADLGIKSPNLEGFLYPDTYKFYEKKPSARECFEAMTRLFFRNLPKNYRSKIEQLNLTLREAVTFASLIEKETMHEFEKPLVAEVIWNRIKRKMPLGIDAALIYGIHNYDGDIKWKDLKNSKNLYNTRIHRGLPPGPIGSVSVSSLKAILNPSQQGYLYYVLIPNSQGKHQFTKTLKEHNKYVRKLIKAKK